QALIESIREFQTYARSKSIELRATLPETNLFTLGDPFLVRHIIDNLLSNAIKYSPPGRPVEVALKNEAGKLSIQVKDEGPGLSPEDMERVFQKGISLSAKPTSGESSRGEGLYLARRFARAMGGQITVKSKPGQGAVFSAQFPKAN
nr:ATP-binding protein [Saprospiraceae bacterium]